MKIKITTIREFPDDEYWNWVRAVNQGGTGPIDGKKLKEEGLITFESEGRIGAFATTRAKTTYEIVK